MSCQHLKATPHAADQTLGVYCPDCNQAWACWDESHIPESILNIAVKNEEGWGRGLASKQK